MLFPNTVPPFFESSQLTALPPTAADYDRRWAGVQAHNRWLVDFCQDAPGRRAGVFQVFANDIDHAVAEVRWAAEQGVLTGGVLLPSVPPNAACPASGSRTTTRCGRSARSSTCPSRCTAAAACPTTASTSPPGP